jgi:hypothetical protein
MNLEEVAQHAKFLLKKQPSKQPLDTMFLSLHIVGWNTLNVKVFFCSTIEMSLSLSTFINYQKNNTIPQREFTSFNGRQDYNLSTVETIC